MELNRRSFLAGTAMAGVSAAGAHMALADENQADATGADTADLMTPEAQARPWAFEIAPEPIDDSQIDEVVEAAVVVLGSGTAGLVTAKSAQEEGLDVIVVSASSAPVSRGGSNNAIYSKEMEREGIERQPVYNIVKEIAEQGCSVRQELWYKYYNNSETAMNWLIDLMEGQGLTTTIERASTLDKDYLWGQALASHAFLGELDGEVYDNPGMTQPLLVNTLARLFEQDGGTVYYSHIGKQLVRGGVANGRDGRVDAVIAQKPDGGYMKFVGTKAVVLATGDFSRDRDMMYKYVPWWAENNEANYSLETDYDAGFTMGGMYKGDGQKMGLWVGAAWQRTFPNCIMGGSISAGPQPTYGENFSGLLVDRNGRRFMNEYCSGTLAGKTCDLQDGKVVYALWCANYAAQPDTWYADNKLETPAYTTEEVLENWTRSANAGTYVMGDTVEEVVEQLGLPEATLDTIERYNELADAGEDTDFYKDPRYLLPLNEGPFFGAKSTDPGFLTVLGGLRTSANLEVCDADDNPIPGLYNVGTMVGDFYAGTYTFQMEGVNYGACCLTFGYLTGKHIAQAE